MEQLRLIARLSTFLLMSLILLLPIALIHSLNFKSIKWVLISTYYKLSCFFWGIRVKQIGQLTQSRPLLLVSNHSSYIDIPTIGSVARVHFTPKSEIASWPIIGSLCRFSECVFINRNPRKTSENMAALEKARSHGGVISLFPEGTTNDGVNLLPFRSSYFSLAEQGLSVQPVTIRYTKRNGEPLSKEIMRQTAWIGDDEFAPHLLQFLRQPSILATVIFHDVISFEGHNRKTLAQACETKVASAL